MIAIFIFSFLTIAVLVSGLVIMAMGGKLNTKFGNKLMSLRVVFQAITIAALALLYYLNKH